MDFKMPNVKKTMFWVYIIKANIEHVPKRQHTLHFLSCWWWVDSGNCNNIQNKINWVMLLKLSHGHFANNCSFIYLYNCLRHKRNITPLWAMGTCKPQMFYIIFHFSHPMKNPNEVSLIYTLFIKVRTIKSSICNCIFYFYDVFF